MLFLQIVTILYKYLFYKIYCLAPYGIRERGQKLGVIQWKRKVETEIKQMEDKKWLDVDFLFILYLIAKKLISKSNDTEIIQKNNNIKFLQYFWILWI